MTFKEFDDYLFARLEQDFMQALTEESKLALVIIYAKNVIKRAKQIYYE